ncbi:MAG: ribosome small subunit-dependent GTPase A [Hyphomicrobiaceae bacterium]|nr:ribosome small subunit-dependent GTPase A [Hyphomicrobiaceae bacterium]
MIRLSNLALAYDQGHEVLAEVDFHLRPGSFHFLTGPSGAGKSSLLNAIEPGLGIRVREVSEKTLKGKHTTSNVTVFRLKDGSLVADTPGFRELGLWRIAAADLGFLFPEFRELIPECRYPSCSHGPEPGCAVKTAVEAGSIDADRYGSYLKLHNEMSTRRKAAAPDGGPLPPV